MADSNPQLHPDTVAVAAGRPDRLGAPVNHGITLASSFASGAGPEYARGDSTDTWIALEEAVGALEGGRALAFSSGMAAISAVLDQLPAGANVVAPADVYQGVAKILSDGEQRYGWQVLRLPTADTQQWLDALPGADLVWLESPSNPTLEIADVPKICAAANRAGVPVAVDNTFATPLNQRPLESGAMFSVQSATKFIGGHSDLLSGIVTVSTTLPHSADAHAGVDSRRTFGGATPGALESYLALRGLRTLPLRLERSQSNAMTLARRLEQHRQVTRVRYPGLPSHPGHELANEILGGPGAMLSFELKGSATGADVRVSRLKLITPATSLGGVETLIERRNKLTGQEHVPPSLLRLSVGVEHVEDLWNDLEQSLSGLSDNT